MQQQLAGATISLSQADRDALAATRRKFSAKDLKRIQKQQQRMQALLRRAAALPRWEESERLCRAFDGASRAVQRELAYGRGRAGAPRAREHRPAGTRRTASSSTSSSADPPDPDPEPADEPWPGGFTFRAFDHLISTALPGHVRLRLFHALPGAWQREAWAALGREMDRKAAAR